MIEVMEERELPIELRAVQSLGLGFDLTNDFRLKFAKGNPGERLVVIDEARTRDIVIPGGRMIQNVSTDIRCDKGDTVRFQSDVLEFNQMSELLNQKSSIQGKVPSGYFNSIFELTGAWLHDATDTKYLAFDSYFVSLYYLHLTASPLLLQEKVKKAVPSIWDPASLARFIQTYGTHIIVGMGVGGQDLLCVRQQPSSSVPSADLKGYLEGLGDRLFADGRRPTPLWKTRDKQKVPEVFYRIMQSNTMHLSSVSESSSKEGLTIICSKRGGNAFLHSHCEWLQTVSSNPDAILFKFVPITSLLTGIPGSGYLSHAINLYLRYKPPKEDLRYFLEFQVPLQYAPMFSELPLGPQRRKVSGPALQFRIMGPKLRVSSTQVSTDRKPVTGLRLYLEGEKCNRLALHLQHLSSIPNILESLWAASKTQRPSEWRGSDDSENSCQYWERVKWKRYSNICTLAVEHDPKWLRGENDGVYVVTGGQLVTRGKWPKTVLHLRLLFTYLPHCSIRKTEWDTVPAVSQKSNFLTSLSTTFLRTEVAGPPKQVPATLNSGIYPDGPPLPANARKLLQYVETAEVVRGPHDIPGHWLVTAAKLAIEGGKIALQTQFALLNYPS